MATFSFGFVSQKMGKALVYALVLCSMVIGLSLAPAGIKIAMAQVGNPDQAIELAGSWQKHEPIFKLIPMGYVIGCQKGKRDKDYKYRIDFGRFSGPFHPDKIFLLPHNDQAKKAITDRGGTLNGYNLNSRSGAYLCIGSWANSRLNNTSLSLFHDQ